MCSMFASEPVSRLSTQITRLPRASSSSHRCDPRKPAPPVTMHVATAGNLRGCGFVCGLGHSVDAASGPPRGSSARLPRNHAGDPLALLSLPDRRLRLDLVDQGGGAREGGGASAYSRLTAITTLIPSVKSESAASASPTLAPSASSSSIWSSPERSRNPANKRTLTRIACNYA